jgi:hypothetical protein
MHEAQSVKVFEQVLKGMPFVSKFATEEVPMQWVKEREIISDEVIIGNCPKEELGIYRKRWDAHMQIE